MPNKAADKTLIKELRTITKDKAQWSTAIRSSDIAFTLGAKGALIQKAHEYTGEIEVF